MKAQRPRKASRPRSRSRKPGMLVLLLGLILSVAPFVIASLVAYVGYQDRVIRDQFEGKRWALPARVYASATEIFVGARFDAEGFEWLLVQLKYRKDPALASPGTFSRIGDEVIFRTRDFNFWDKPEQGRELRAQFQEGQIILLEEMDSSAPIALLRMEPIQIGSFYPARHEDRVLIKLDQAPDVLLKALFASEDHSFYEHHGVSLRGILRAVWVNLRAGGIVQGGSTLTQQLVKNFYLTSERTWWRKVNEIVMSVILDWRYSKDEILEAYLNEFYLGQDGGRAIHGFGLASQYYFARPIEVLELHHTALLVSLVRGPSYYDPYRYPDRVLKRRDLILDEMVDQGFIESDAAEEAKRHPLDVVVDPHQPGGRYPAFMDLVRRQLQKEYRPEDLTSEGLHIYTTLDVYVQRQLEDAMANNLALLEKNPKSRQLETAAIMTRRSTGEIAAMSGSRHPETTGFNRALDALRQIGSLFKPVVYLTALEHSDRYTLTTPLQDTPIEIKTPGSVWEPKNYDGKIHGTIPLFSALAHSYNLATVRLGMDLGLSKTAQTLRDLGIERKIDMVPSMLLGTASLSPFEVTQMYQTLASDGFLTPLRAIQAVVSPEGKVLQRYGLDVRQTVDPQAVFLVNAALKEVLRSGTAKPAYNYLPKDQVAAGKTGTTNDMRDSWFAGYTGDYLGVVWVGRDDNQPAGLTGAEGALKVWASTMKRVSHESLDLEKPDHVNLIWVDGSLTGQGCLELPYLEGSEPQESSACRGKSDAPQD